MADKILHMVCFVEHVAGAIRHMVHDVDHMGNFKDEMSGVVCQMVNVVRYMVCFVRHMGNVVEHMARGVDQMVFFASDMENFVRRPVLPHFIQRIGDGGLNFARAVPRKSSCRKRISPAPTNFSTLSARMSFDLKLLKLL